MASNKKSYILCLSCDIAHECDTDCDEAINYRPIPEKYKSKEKYVSKGTGFAFRRLDGSKSTDMTNDKYLRK